VTRLAAIAVLAGLLAALPFAARAEDAAQAKAAAQAAQLKARLDANPSDAALRNLTVRTYVVDLDMPQEAAKYVAEGLDADLAKFVPAAAKGLDNTPELACLELGDWYRGLAEKAGPSARPAMIARTKGYYERFLALHTAQDIARAQAVIGLKKLDQIVALPPPAAAPSAAAPPKAVPRVKPKTPAASEPAASRDPKPGDATDLLALIDPVRDNLRGTPANLWRRQGQALVGSTGNTGKIDWAGITAPATVTGDYELIVRLQFSQLEGSLFIFLPFKSGAVSLMLTTGKSGLCAVDSYSPEHNPTGTQTTIILNRVYTVRAQVSGQGDRISINADWDGKPLVRWQGQASALANKMIGYESPTKNVTHDGDKKCLGFGLYRSGVTILSAQLRMFSGETKTLR